VHALHLVLGAECETPTARSVAWLAEAIGKVLKRDLQEFGLSRRHRLSAQPDHPLSQAARLALHLCKAPAELYVMSGARLVEVGLADPPVVVLDDELARRSQAAQVFLIARALLLTSVGLHPLVVLTADELTQVIAAVSSRGSKELADSLYKAMPRKFRKQLESAAPQLAAQPAQSPAAWQAAVLRAANGVAAIACGDLSGAAEGLRAIGEGSGGGDDEVAALVRFWASPQAKAVRAHIGRA
jgi:hypothetical protein